MIRNNLINLQKQQSLLLPYYQKLNLNNVYFKTQINLMNRQIFAFCSSNNNQQSNQKQKHFSNNKDTLTEKWNQIQAKNTTRLRIINQLKPYIIPYMHKEKKVTKLLWKAYSFLILGKTFFYAGPVCVKHGINALQQEDFQTSMYLFLGYGACYSLYVLLDGERNKSLGHIQQMALHNITEKTYNHLLKLDPSYHFSGSQRSKLYDIYKAQKSYENTLRILSNFFIPLMTDIALSSVFLFYYCGPEFFVSFIATYAAYSYFTLDTSARRLVGMRNQKRLERKADFTMGETLTNFYNVKYYNAEQFEKKRFQTILDDYSEQVIYNQKTLAQLNTGQRVVFSIGLTFNLMYGTHQISKGILTAGDLVLMQSLMMQIISPLFFLGVMYREFQDSAIDIQRLYALLDIQPKIIESANAKNYEFKGGEIEIKNIKFQYNQDKLIYNNFNLHIPSNSWISIVGESGIGKSTICNLIFRLYEISEGEIYLDGQNLQELKVDSYRSKIGVISQTPYMFNDTLLNNFLYANQKSTKEEIIEICKALQLHDMIMQLPQQYDTMVGEQGGKFSGGEKQRISIVRCLLRNPDILIMDEPTSSLDSQNEYNVMDYIQNLRRKKKMCIIMITHRLNLNNYADKIIYLGKNNYQETGTHMELLSNSNSRYSSLWEEFITEEREDKQKEIKKELKEQQKKELEEAQSVNIQQEN